MSHLDPESRAEFELAVENAWNQGRNGRERTEAFIEAVRDAEQAQREWALELLDGALRDGMWKRLKEHRKKLEPMIVAFAHNEHAIPSVGGVARRTEVGIEYHQLSFVDMTKDELLRKEREYQVSEFATRRNRFAVRQLIKLIDKADTATTAREAGRELDVDVAEYLALEAS